MKKRLKIGLWAVLALATAAVLAWLFFLPRADRYVLKVTSLGNDEVEVDGRYLIGEPGSPTLQFYGSTPFVVKGEGARVQANFQAVGGRGWIRVTLHNPRQDRWGAVAAGEGRWVTLEWARPGQGPRIVRANED